MNYSVMTTEKFEDLESLYSAIKEKFEDIESLYSAIEEKYEELEKSISILDARAEEEEEEKETVEEVVNIMTTTISTQLVELLEYVSGSYEAEDISFYVSKRYSGRFMYGETCVGFCLAQNADWSDIFDMFESVNPYLFKIVKRELKELKECTRTDSMGLDKIYYFPGYQFPGN